MWHIDIKRYKNRLIFWYMLHLVALRDTDLSLCPPRWMNITLWVKKTLQWILRALCKPSQACPMDIREACLWVRDMRLRWWQNRWLPMATMRTDRPINHRQDACSGCFSLEMRKFCSYCLDSIKLSVSLQCTAMCRDRVSDRVPPTGHRWVSHFYFTSFSMFSSMM